MASYLFVCHCFSPFLWIAAVKWFTLTSFFYTCQGLPGQTWFWILLGKILTLVLCLVALVLRHKIGYEWSISFVTMMVSVWGFPFKLYWRKWIHLLLNVRAPGFVTAGYFQCQCQFHFSFFFFLLVLCYFIVQYNFPERWFTKNLVSIEPLCIINCCFLKMVMIVFEQRKCFEEETPTASTLSLHLSPGGCLSNTFKIQRLDHHSTLFSAS